MDDTFYHILPSGIRIVHRRVASPVVYTGIMVGAGTRDEDAAINGMAHYVEHCVFKGCEHANRVSGTAAPKLLSARQIINRIEGVGAEINAYTTKEETVFYAATPKAYFARTLGLIASMVLHPTFPKEETDKEVSVILDEIESYNDSPSELIYDDFEGLVFKGHPLSMPILGSRKTLKQISHSPQNPLRWMATHYLPERIVVFSQGDLPFSSVLRTIERAMETGADMGVHTPFVRHCPISGACQSVSYKKHTHQAHVMAGGRACEIGHKNQLGLYLLNNILGGGSLSSRLNLNVREKKGLVYSIESQYTPLSDTGYWSIYFASEPHHKDYCMELCRKELKRMRENPLSGLQLQRALKQLHGQMAISAENQENNALAMAKLTMYHNYAPTWEETFRQIQQVTPQQLLEIANEIYSENNLWMLSYE